MLEIDLDPNLVGGLSWHGVFTALGVAIAVVVVARLAPSMKVDPSIVYSTATWAVPGGIVGARIVHVIDNWGFFTDNPEEIFFIWRGGVGLFGAILGGTITGVVYAWTRGYPVAKLADLTAPALLIAQAVGRVGDVINGEHFSNTTDLPWAWVHTHPDWPGLNHPTPEFPGGLPAIPDEAAGIGYQPSVGYEMVMDVVLLFLIWRLLGRVAPDGIVMLIYLSLYSLGRFAIQFSRDDPERLGALQQGHVISLIVIGVCVLLIAYLSYRRRSYAPAEAAELSGK
ncbi:MAG: prolipoprotein diacylglyceryl transferase [Dehalococcoidia bacterium]